MYMEFLLLVEKAYVCRRVLFLKEAVHILEYHFKSKLDVFIINLLITYIKAINHFTPIVFRVSTIDDQRKDISKRSMLTLPSMRSVQTCCSKSSSLIS